MALTGICCINLISDINSKAIKTLMLLLLIINVALCHLSYPL